MRGLGVILAALTAFFTTPSQALSRNEGSAFFPRYTQMEFFRNLSKLPTTPVAAAVDKPAMFVVSSINCIYSERMINILSSNKYKMSGNFILVDVATPEQTYKAYLSYKHRSPVVFRNILSMKDMGPNTLSREESEIITSLSASILGVQEVVSSGFGIPMQSPGIFTNVRQFGLVHLVGLPNFEKLEGDILPTDDVDTKNQYQANIDEILDMSSGFSSTPQPAPVRRIEAAVPAYLWPDRRAAHLIDIPAGASVTVLGKKTVGDVRWVRVAPFKNQKMWFYITE